MASKTKSQNDAEFLPAMIHARAYSSISPLIPSVKTYLHKFDWLMVPCPPFHNHFRADHYGLRVWSDDH